jgi:branched-chain amino acid transport system substrate-binding protein
MKVFGTRVQLRRPLIVALASATMLTGVLGTATAPADAATSGQIVIGDIGTYSGSNSGDFASAGSAMKAWAQWTNAHGGIDGKQVKLDLLDDAGSASSALTDAKELVQQDHVTAIVGQMSTPAPVWASYVAQAGVPVVGGNPSDPLYFQNANFYPDAATANASFATIVKATGKASQRGGFFYCTENPACSELQPILKAAYTSAGGKALSISPISASSPNFTAQCLAARSAKVQSIYVAAAAQTIATVAGNCSQQKYYPYFLTDLLAVNPAVATQLSKVQGFQMLANSDNFPFFQTSSPAIKTFRQALTKYAPSALAPDTLTENAVSAWASGQLFITAVKASGSKTVTSASVKKGLYSLPKNTTVGGLTPPLNYVKGKTTTVPCVYVAGLTSKGLSMPKGTKAFC